MTADEIRAMDISPEAGDTNNLLQEIAAQLAEQTDELRKMRGLYERAFWPRNPNGATP